MADKRFVAKNGLDNNSQTITNVATPTNATDAASKSYADGLVTDAAITGKLLTGYTAGSNTALAAADSILAAMGKIQGQLNARLSTSTTSTQSGYFGDIFLYDDSTPSHYLGITNSANLTAARTLSLNVNDADRTISLSGNLTVSAAATVSGTNTGDQTTISGNAGTATTLQTARSINGTAFNGSADITTANWGTARTITIGATGKSVNGSAAVSWTLAEIGALGVSAKAADSDALDGLDSSVFLYGINGSGSRTLAVTQNVYELGQYKAGFWDVVSASWMPGTGWWWGATFAHASNTSSYNFSGQLAFSNGGGGDDLWARTIGNGTASSWSRLLSSGNYGSYALPLSGGTVTGALTVDTTNAQPFKVRRAGGASSLVVSTDNVGTAIPRAVLYYSRGDATTDQTGHAFYTRNATATDNLVFSIDHTGKIAATGSVVIGTDPGGSAALRVGSGGIQTSGTIYASDFVLTGGAGSGTGLTLDNLDDVVITSPASAQYLRYNGTSWVNQTIQTADLGTGTANSTTFLRGDRTWAVASLVGVLDDLTDVTITSAANNDLLRYNGSQWVNSSAAVPAAVKLNSQGDYANATPGNTRGPSGFNLYDVYVNGYPTNYGSLLHMSGRGGGQLLVGWSGTDGAHAPNYVRSKRDNDSGAWSPWALLLTDVNYSSYALPLGGGTMTGAITFAAGQTWPTFNQSTTGNAATATKLQTARTINGVSFDGSANITVADSTKLPLAGGSLTGPVSITPNLAWNNATPALNVGGSGDGRIQVRHIWGKSAGSTGVDHLWLNYQNTGNHVQIGDSGGGNNLYVSGNIYANGYFTGNLVLTAGNYNSYAPSLTGGGASGTWGINITGNAGSASSVAWGNVSSKPSLMYYAGINSGNWQNFTDDVGELRVDEVHNINAGGHSNQPPNVYTYGGVLSWRLANHSFQLYASHTGDLTFKTQWNLDNYSGWRRILHESNYNSFAPTLTGVGANGTWGINVTGTAGSISGYNNPTTAATGNTIAYRTSLGDIAVREITLEVAVQDFTPSSMVAIYPTTNQAVKVTAGGARNFLDVPTRSGGNASGTWGINVSGQSRAVYDSGYGVTELTWRQTPDGFAGYSGWASYMINNHGTGSSYYNQTLIMPFWSAPQYSRLEGGTFRGPYTILSTENYSSYALPLSGGTISGNLTFGGASNKTITFQTASNWYYYLNAVNDDFRLYDAQGVEFFYSAYNGGGTGKFIRFMGSTLRVNNNSTVSITGSLSVSSTVTSSGNMTAPDFVLSSDARFKTDLVPLSAALASLERIDAYRYTHTVHKRQEVGVLAQEVREVLPEAVTEDADGMLGVSYDRLVPLLLAAVKELSARVKTLEKQQ